MSNTRHLPKPDVFDLDALEVEVTGKPFPFKLGGETFTLPAASDLDWRVAVRLDGDPTGGLRDVMGDAEFERFSKHKLPIGKLSALLQAWQKHQGLEPGESPASTGS